MPDIHLGHGAVLALQGEDFSLAVVQGRRPAMHLRRLGLGVRHVRRVVRSRVPVAGGEIMSGKRSSQVYGDVEPRVSSQGRGTEAVLRQLIAMSCHGAEGAARWHPPRRHYSSE